VKDFIELGVDKNIVKGLKELNIVEPTDIQSEVIPVLLNNVTDLVGQAQTGTGKTAAFGLPLLHRIDPKKDVVQGLILCPTRELGKQVAKQLFRFTKYTDKIFTEAVYGGEYIDIQIKKLKRPTHIIVATPGRLIDLVERKAVDLSHVRTVVLDEADEMLSMGFKAELDKILTLVPNDVIKWLFSATMPHGIQEIVNKHMSPEAYKVEIKSRGVVNKNIEHQFCICDEQEKPHVLFQFLKSQHKNRGLVFCKTKVIADKLTKQLIAKNFPADVIHGDLLQKERDKAMRAFKNENVQILVATDIAARGIDIDGLAFVVHYQLPEKDEYYTHRSGRTARAGKEGISLSIVTSYEMKQLRYLERTLDIIFNQVR
jgi:ATP-dependent RNA helicase DeaD